ncbi:hypothetical protein JG688_00016756 [Phytophthora aleatoria]|uniref:Uncharacterized protein n=1 Tax=Phytophthora aleatoria TaxID=2496075 RepID=A0A8J5IF43_9STRA|nr:hypothetical protein JG688_00016756 [Phytophthora aleatoria]
MPPDKIAKALLRARKLLMSRSVSRTSLSQVLGHYGTSAPAFVRPGPSSSASRSCIVAHLVGVRLYCLVMHGLTCYGLNISWYMVNLRGYRWHSSIDYPSPLYISTWMQVMLVSALFTRLRRSSCVSSSARMSVL